MVFALVVQQAWRSCGTCDIGDLCQTPATKQQTCRFITHNVNILQHYERRRQKQCAWFQLASVHRRYPPWRVTVYIRAMSLTPTLRRHFRQKFWPHEKTEPLLLLFEAWAFTWYRYWPASNVPLREKCTEKWCPWGYCTHFQTLFPTEILAARKNWTLLLPFNAWAFTWYR